MNCPYVMSFLKLFWMSFLCINVIMFVGFLIRLSTPFARRPNLFADDVLHFSCILGFLSIACNWKAYLFLSPRLLTLGGRHFLIVWCDLLVITCVSWLSTWLFMHVPFASYFPFALTMCVLLFCWMVRVRPYMLLMLCCALVRLRLLQVPLWLYNALFSFFVWLSVTVPPLELLVWILSKIVGWPVSLILFDRAHCCCC